MRQRDLRRIVCREVLGRFRVWYHLSFFSDMDLKISDRPEDSQYFDTAIYLKEAIEETIEKFRRGEI